MRSAVTYRSIDRSAAPQEITAIFVPGTIQPHCCSSHCAPTRAYIIHNSPSIARYRPCFAIRQPAFGKCRVVSAATNSILWTLSQRQLLRSSPRHRWICPYRRCRIAERRVNRVGVEFTSIFFLRARLSFRVSVTIVFSIGSAGRLPRIRIVRAERCLLSSSSQRLVVGP